MINKILWGLKTTYNDIKNAVLERKTHFYICLGAFLIGLLLAVSRDFSEVEETTNFVFVVLKVNTSPIPQLLRVLLWSALVYVAIYLSALHFCVFVVMVYGGIFLASYLMWCYTFTAIAVDALTGVLFMIFYILPTIIVTFCAIVIITGRIYDLAGYAYNRKCRVNIACHHRAVCNEIKPIFIVNILFNLVWWLIFYLILLISVK